MQSSHKHDEETSPTTHTTYCGARTSLFGLPTIRCPMSCASTFTCALARSAENSVTGVDAASRGAGTAHERSAAKETDAEPTTSTTNHHTTGDGTMRAFTSRGVAAAIAASSKESGAARPKRAPCCCACLRPVRRVAVVAMPVCHVVATAVRRGCHCVLHACTVTTTRNRELQNFCFFSGAGLRRRLGSQPWIPRSSQDCVMCFRGHQHGLPSFSSRAAMWCKVFK